jgi:hypothetical protein
MAENDDDQTLEALESLLATSFLDRLRLCTDFEKYLLGFRTRVLARIQKMLALHPEGIKVQVIIEAEYEKIAHFHHPDEPVSEYDEIADIIVHEGYGRKSSRLMAMNEHAAVAKRQGKDPHKYNDELEQYKHKVVAFYLRTKFIPVTLGGSANIVASELIEQLRERHINFIRDGSGFMMRRIIQTEVNIARYAPLVGRGYVALPPFLGNKKAIVNVKNGDDRCFAYAIAAAIQNDNSRNAQRSERYNVTIVEQGLDLLEFPVKFDAQYLEKVEQQIQIPFNVYSFFDDEGRGRYAAFTSKLDADGAVDLLYWNAHFAWIKNFSRFMGDLTKHKGTLHYCKRCMGHFQSDSAFAMHKLCCRGAEGCIPVYKMPSKPTLVEFKQIRYEQRCPFVIYADFECLTKPLPLLVEAEDVDAPAPVTTSVAAHDDAASGKDDSSAEELVQATSAVGSNDGDATTLPKIRTAVAAGAYQEHEPISVGMKLISAVPGVLGDMPYETHTGGDVIMWFLNRLMFYEALCTQYLFDNKRLVMTAEDVRKHEAAKLCYVCNGGFGETDGRSVAVAWSKVRDHDHITGKYRGATHSKCNLQLRRTYKIPVFFHNFRGYDSHLMIRAFGAYKDRELRVIGQTLEKYMTVSWGDHIVFKDSLQFLNSSLERLTECVLKGGRDKFQHLIDAFSPAYDDEAINKLLRKGIYPYDYMSAASCLQETALPPISEFASRLRDEKCSEQDYAHAEDVWKTFQCAKFLDYHNLYLKCDVLLLAGIFESFRSMSLATYGLDPAHYVSSPHLSWNAMLKQTQCKLELLQDPAMFAMLQDNLRGGVAMISKRHVEANNKYMGAQYDTSKPSTYILYLDANNLYGWAMGEPMPISDFRWLAEPEWSGINWTQQAIDQEIGYIIECDLKYPHNLHDLHNDYPLAPERLTVTTLMLSEAQVALRDKYEFAVKPKPSTKLIPNLFDKERYTCHYRNLRFYLEHGLELTKVHRVLAFRQSRWLAPYISLNSEMRGKAKTAFEKDFWKLMNNALFGKTCENVTKRNDVRLMVDRAKCEVLMRKPHCLGFKIFSKDIAAVAMQKLICLIEKPTYVGYCVLELAKLLMYEFHYDHAQKRWPNEHLKLLLTDTDSLVYEIQTDDVYEDITSDPTFAACFDLSNYPASSKFHSDANKMVIGKMKDESGGNIITGVVGLRAKMYAYRWQAPELDADVQPPSNKEAKRMKGIQRAAQNTIYYNDFVAQLHEPTANYVCAHRIGQALHNIFSIELSKQGLCAFDDKRFLLPDGITTLAHGHIRTYDEFRVMFEQVERTFVEAEVRLQKAMNMVTSVMAVAHAGSRAHNNEMNVVDMVVVDDGDGDRMLVLTHDAAVARSLVPHITLHDAIDIVAGSDLCATFAAAHARIDAIPALQTINEEDGLDTRPDALLSHAQDATLALALFDT